MSLAAEAFLEFKPDSLVFTVRHRPTISIGRESDVSSMHVRRSIASIAYKRAAVGAAKTVHVRGLWETAAEPCTGEPVPHAGHPSLTEPCVQKRSSVPH
jgi:hypothetical protein